MSNLFTLPKQVIFTNSGALIPGAKVYFFEAGTATPLSVYTDYTLGTAHTHPVVADGNGRLPAIYYASDNYKVTIADAAGVEIYSQDYAATLITQAEVGAALYHITAAETGAAVTPTNYSYPPGNVLRYGAVAGGTAATNVTAIQAAIDTNHEIYIPAGTYSIDSTLTWNGVSTTIRGEGGFNSVLQWNGVANGTMMDTTASLRHMSKIEDVYFDANESADICLHVKKIARQMTINRCLFTDARAGEAIRLGDFTNDAADADIANFIVNDSEFLDNQHGIYWDSQNAVGVTLTGNYFSSVVAGTVTSHLRMVRGGDVFAHSNFFGGYSSGGNDYAVYIKDGWGYFDSNGFEYGITPNNGGTLHLDTPALSTSGTNRQVGFLNNRIFSKGDAAAGNHIKISSSNHPLFFQNNTISGKSVLTTFVINNTGNSQILSVFNLYEGKAWDAPEQPYIQSIQDTYDDGSTFFPVGNILGRTKTITSSDSPYTVLGEDTIRSNSGAVTLNLPAAAGDANVSGGQHRRITVIRTSAGGVTTITPAGAETINGAATIAMSSGAEHSVTLESDGSSNWHILSWYVENTVQAPSSGTGVVKMGSANPADSAGWLEVSPGKYIPYWTDTTP